MIYELTKNKFKTNIHKFKKNHLYFICINKDELAILNSIFYNDQIFNTILNNHILFEQAENYVLTKFNLKTNNQKLKMTIIIYYNFLIVIDYNNTPNLNQLINESLMNINKDFSFNHIIAVIIDHLTNNCFNQLEYIEQKIINIEQELLNKEVYKNLNPVIFSIKKELIEYKRYFEYLSNFTCQIDNNKTDKYIISKYNKLQRLKEISVNLIENTVQLREIYQSHLDYYQNRVIKILTVATAFFLPLTVITSWYGMNLKYIPEIDNQYTYPIIILISSLFIIICYLIFKKKKII